MVFRCPNTDAHYNWAEMCPNFGTSDNSLFSILEQMENLLFLGVPLRKHIMVFWNCILENFYRLPW